MDTQTPILSLFFEFVETKDGIRPDDEDAGGLLFKMGPSLGKDIEGLMSGLRSGELAVDPLERQLVLGLQCSALEAVMLDCLTTERLQFLRPVLEWLYTEKGLSPWDGREGKDGQLVCGYDWLVSLSRRFEEERGVLQWCWDLPDAPTSVLKIWVGNKHNQIAYDQMGSLVMRHEPMDSRMIKEIGKANLDPLKAWPNGLRPLDMLLEHALPWNDCDEDGTPWEGFGPDGRERSRAAHEWVNVIRNISRVGLSMKQPGRLCPARQRGL